MSTFYCSPRGSVGPQWKCKKSCHDKSQGVIFKMWLLCGSLLYSYFFHGDIFIRALFAMEIKSINSSTCPKQQDPLSCSHLTNGQKYLPNSVLQETLFNLSDSCCQRAQLYMLFCEESLGLRLGGTCWSRKTFLCLLLVPVSVRSQIFMTWEKSSPCFSAQHIPLEY